MDFGKKEGYALTYTTTATGKSYAYSEALESAICSPFTFSTTFKMVADKEVDRYIINDGATIIFWNDGSKTISKRDKKDKFDKELGFLFAYFYGKYKGSKASMKRVLDTIDYKKIKTFLFEFYVNNSENSDYEKARKYLSNLDVAN